MPRLLAVWLPRRSDDDPAADRAALVALARWCHRFAPTAGIEEAERPETLLLDVTNLAPLYGGEEALVRQVARSLAEEGWNARLALADSLGAAWAVAHSQAACEGVVIVPPGGARGALATLPPATLRLSAEVCATLTALGIERVEQLLAIPREQIRSRLGPAVLLRIDQALAARPETFVVVPPTEELLVERRLEDALGDGERIARLVEELADRLAHLLAARQRGALAVACRLHCDGAPTVTLHLGLFHPSAHGPHLAGLLREELDRTRLPAPLVGAALEAVRTALLLERQGSLFEEDRSLEGSRELGRLVDRLAARLGGERVVRARLASETQPELAWRESALAGADAEASAPQRRRGSRLAAELRSAGARTASAAQCGPCDRPLFLLPQPAALEVLAVAPDGPPIRFRYAGQLHEVERHWGPERIETGWWRRRTAARDYYRVETVQGRRYWLFRDLRSGRWSLQGVFE